jgi:hypothetical protein
VSILLLLYGIETPEADQPPTPTPTPTGGAGGTQISGGNLRKRQYPVIIFNRKIERDDEEVLLIGDA